MDAAAIVLEEIGGEDVPELDVAVLVVEGELRGGEREGRIEPGMMWGHGALLRRMRQG
jgi:hypothetical protein